MCIKMDRTMQSLDSLSFSRKERTSRLSRKPWSSLDFDFLTQKVLSTLKTIWSLSKTRLFFMRPMGMILILRVVLESTK